MTTLLPARGKMYRYFPPAPDRPIGGYWIRS
jgi:hypothetical protein